MENQHRRISGYRELSELDVDLMNRAKSHEKVLMGLVLEIRTRLATQRAAATTAGDAAEIERLNFAEPERWAAMARTDFQTGFMALVRSIAQPGVPQ